MSASIEQLVQQVKIAGPDSLRAAARLMTHMTNEPQHLIELLAGDHDWPQPKLVLGVTGAPGSGKSTLVDRMAHEYRLCHPDKKLGIVAVDPSSPFTGGALLGDRVRMMRHSTDPEIFIRSLASRGHLGGLALGVRGVVRVMGLWGCEVVIVETVGVGQSEVEIVKQADVVLVVLAPGQGDSVQLLKAGLIEVGDLFIVNKCDCPGALELKQQLLTAIGSAWSVQKNGCRAMATRTEHDVWNEPPKVFACSAANHEGIPLVVAELERLVADNGKNWQASRERQSFEEIQEAVLEEAHRRLTKSLRSNGTEHTSMRSVLDGTKSLNDFVVDLLQRSTREM